MARVGQPIDKSTFSASEARLVRICDFRRFGGLSGVNEPEPRSLTRGPLPAGASSVRSTMRSQTMIGPNYIITRLTNPTVFLKQHVDGKWIHCRHCDTIIRL